MTEGTPKPREPTPWVIVIDAMTHEQAVDLGKVMGSKGLTGQFLGGDLARNLQRFSEWQRGQGEGGDA